MPFHLFPCLFLVPTCPFSGLCRVQSLSSWCLELFSSRDALVLATRHRPLLCAQEEDFSCPFTEERSDDDDDFDKLCTDDGWGMASTYGCNGRWHLCGGGAVAWRAQGSTQQLRSSGVGGSRSAGQGRARQLRQSRAEEEHCSLDENNRKLYGRLRCTYSRESWGWGHGKAHLKLMDRLRTRAKCKAPDAPLPPLGRISVVESRSGEAVPYAPSPFFSQPPLRLFFI